MSHISLVGRLLVLACAVAGTSAGVLWMKNETPHPGGAVALRQAPLAEARSLKPLLETAQAAALAPIAIQKGLANAPVSGQTLPAPLVALREWPREVALDGPLEVTAVAVSGKGKEHVYHTSHFEFVSEVPLKREVVSQFARAFEATHLLHAVLPLDLKPAPEGLRKLFRVRLLTPEAASATPGAAASPGFYSYADKCVFAPLSSLGVRLVDGQAVLEPGASANDTLLHEVTHQMMNRWLPLLPVWLIEGSAEYVASADLADGRFLLGQMQDRLKHRLRGRGARQIGPSVRMGVLNLAELLALRGKAWNAVLGTSAANENHASALLLTYYLFHLDRGRQGAGTIAMLRAVENGMTHEQAVRDFILAGRHPAELEGEMGLAYARIGVELQFTKRGGPTFKP